MPSDATPNFTTGQPTWTWPDWRQARPGQRFEHVRTGHTGTFVAVSKSRHNGALVDWDDRGYGVKRSNVVSPAVDLRPR